MEGIVGLNPPSKILNRKVPWSQTEGISKKKKPAELSIKAMVVSCERIFNTN